MSIQPFTPNAVEGFWQNLERQAGHTIVPAEQFSLSAYMMRSPEDEEKRRKNAAEFEAAIRQSEIAAAEYRALCEAAQQMWRRAWEEKGRTTSLVLAPGGPLCAKLRHAIALDPERPEAYQILAQVLERHDVTEALECHLSAMEFTDPDTLGWAASVAGAFGCLVHPVCEGARRQLEWWNDEDLKDLSGRVVAVDSGSGAALQMRGDVLDGRLGLWEIQHRTAMEMLEAEAALLAAAAKCPPVPENVLAIQKLKQRARECQRMAREDLNAANMPRLAAEESYAPAAAKPKGSMPLTSSKPRWEQKEPPTTGRSQLRPSNVARAMHYLKDSRALPDESGEEARQYRRRAVRAAEADDSDSDDELSKRNAAVPKPTWDAKVYKKPGLIGHDLVTPASKIRQPAYQQRYLSSNPRLDW